MFDSISIRQQKIGEARNLIDLGFLAESMLFYQNVHVIANNGILEQLMTALGPKLVLDFLESEQLRISFLDDGLAIQTENTNTRYEQHRPLRYEIDRLSLHEFLPSLLQKLASHFSKPRRLESRLLDYIQPIKHEGMVITQTLEDYKDSTYVNNFVAICLELVAPHYKIPEPLVFNIDSKGEYLFIETNIDFQKANESYHKHILPSHSTLSAAHLLSILLNTCGDLYFAALYQSELASDALRSKIMQMKFEKIVRSRSSSQKQIELFEEFVLNDAKAIREAINNGHRSFKDVKQLLKKAKTFRNWVKKQPVDKDLIKAYVQEISRLSWVKKLPCKTVRWSLFTLLGVGVDAFGTVLGPGVGTAIGAGLSVADTFLLDKLISGWKPNQFVEEDLKTFVTK